jgi:BASS family bile acid:Na+ symporter
VTRPDEITAGQALGQKNSGFLIWLGYSYMTPVTSVAGGLHSIWQNIINSLELYEQSHRTGKRINKH